jgi:hypothetical protein
MARWLSIVLIVLVLANGAAESVDLGGLAERILAAYVAAAMAALALLASRHLRESSHDAVPGADGGPADDARPAPA